MESWVKTPKTCREEEEGEKDWGVGGFVKWKDVLNECHRAEIARKTPLNKALASTEQGTGKTLTRLFWQQDKHVKIHMPR